MESYLIKHEASIVRQLDDTSEIVIIVPEILNLSDFTEVVFEVTNTNKKQLLEKKLTNSSLIINDQVITIPILVSDTTNIQAGSHRWTLKVSNNTEFYTIGKGLFKFV